MFNVSHKWRKHDLTMLGRSGRQICGECKTEGRDTTRDTTLQRHWLLCFIRNQTISNTPFQTQVENQFKENHLRFVLDGAWTLRDWCWFEVVWGGQQLVMLPLINPSLLSTCEWLRYFHTAHRPRRQHLWRNHPMFCSRTPGGNCVQTCRTECRVQLGVTVLEKHYESSFEIPLPQIRKYRSFFMRETDLSKSIYLTILQIQIIIFLWSCKTE